MIPVSLSPHRFRLSFDSGNGVGVLTFAPDHIQSGTDTVTIIATDFLFDAVERVVITVGEVDAGSTVGLFEPWPNPADTCVNVAIPAAIINAIVDALSSYHVTDVPMPATPERIWRIIQSAGA